MNQKLKRYWAGVGLCLLIFITACDNPMGMGQSVDLEPPVLKVTSIILPDGTVIPIEEKDNMLYIGPGILVGTGFILEGEARDNVKVERIVVEEIGSNAPVINGKTPLWDNARIASASKRGETQAWSVVLDGITKGERNIRITAYDRVTEPGPDSVKQITLLVDTDPPFVKDIKIERQPGLTVGLLPKIKLEEMDPNLFEHIDYFQNENFTIRAAIEHDFSLAGVTLNFLDENGKELFEQGLQRASGTLYTPAWNIAARDIIAANPVYVSGRHYLKVTITAQAEAGHSGRNEDVTNLLYNLCWYPEADNPHIEMAVQPVAGGMYRFEKSSIIPVRVFDDDNVDKVYAGMITVDAWAAYMPGSPDNEKLQSLINNPGALTQIKQVPLSGLMRNAVVSVDGEDTRGEYRLVVLAQDHKGSGIPGVWVQAIFKILVVEEGIPDIMVDEPGENTSPALTNGRFTIKGTVQNLDELEKIRIAWISANITDANTAGKDALLSGAVGIPSNGIKVWEQALPSGTNVSFGGKTYKSQAFSITLDIFTDFIYNGNVENEAKFFLLYAQGRAGDDVFTTFRLLPYTKPPKIEITSPTNFEPIAPHSTINFAIKVTADSGVPIADNAVILTASKNSQNISLSRTNGTNVWAGTTTGEGDKGEYNYQVTATDRLGNTAQQEVYVSVTKDPELLRITSPHNSGVVFSTRETITIQAVFDGPVQIQSGTPRLRLEGLGGTVRYANYTSGSGTTTLNFGYTPQSGDYTGVPGPGTGLTVTAFDLNGGIITAVTPNVGSLGMSNNIPETKRLNVDGRAPTITGIALSGVDGDPDYFKAPGWWLRAGAAVEARVTASREIKVMGTPNLILRFNGNVAKNASFQKMENNNQTMVFSYTIQANDAAEPVNCTAASCFSNTDRQMIIDTAGSNGNYLVLTGTPAPTGTVNVDAVAPAVLQVLYTVKSNNARTIRIVNTSNNIETDAAKVEYTIDNGLNWNTVSPPHSNTNLTFSVNTPNSYIVFARQTDRAGNVSPTTGSVSDPAINVAADKLGFTIASPCELVELVCNNPDSAYAQGATLIFRLVFSGKVTNLASGTSITLSGTLNGSANTWDFTFPVQNTAGYFLDYTWTVPAGIIMNPVTVTAINVGGVRGENGSPPSTVNPAASLYTSRPNLKVMSVRPTITAINSNAITSTTTVLAAANNTVTLTFSHAVWPEKGLITIKPASGWLIPPVLSNEGFAKINNAVNAADQTALTNSGNTSYYIKTTHGLKQETRSGTTYYVPDTDTKYVLNFTSGLDNAVLRPILERAKYLWQEIESVSASQVTGSGGAAIGTAGTTTVELHLETLPNGRQWKIEIAEGAFRDEAGNTFAGWLPASVYTFWSAKTANPVIRVNRVSNNRAFAASAGTLQTGVDYRIDCETPGATIQFGDTRSSTTHTSTVSASTDTGIYKANDNDGPQNSAIPDATAAVMAGISLAAYSTNQTISDGLYTTARKDYIAATAQRSTAPGLTVSDRSYEGAFKTVVVYRNVSVQLRSGDDGSSGRFLKIEATNTRNGAVTISGFPLNYNDMSGNSSKFAYRNGAADTSDWIWISWEIVSEFWQVSPLSIVSTQPGALFNYGINDNSWKPFSANFFVHNYRKYGNWGMQVGNN